MLLFTITIIPLIKYTQAILSQKYNSIGYLNRAQQSHPHQLHFPWLIVTHALPNYLSLCSPDGKPERSEVSLTKTGPYDHITWDKLGLERSLGRLDSRPPLTHPLMLDKHILLLCLLVSLLRCPRVFLLI